MLREDDLAVRTEGVLTLGQITGLVDTVDHLGNISAHLTVSGGEVVVIVTNLDQTGLLDQTIDVVVVAFDTILQLDYQLAVRTEGICSGSEGSIAGFVKVEYSTGSITGHIAVGSGEVVICITYLGQTGLLNNSIDIVVVAFNAIFLNHLTVSTKCVGTYRHQSVGLFDIIFSGYNFTLIVDVIVVIVDQQHTGESCITVHQIISTVGGFQHTIAGHGLDVLAVLSKLIHAIVIVMGESAVLNDLVAFETSTAFAEVVGSAVNLSPAQSIIVRSVVVTHAVSCFVPNTTQQLTVLELIVQEDAAAQLMADYTLCGLLGAAAEIIPFIINVLPAVDQLAINQIVPVLASLHQTGSGHSFTACGALQVIVVGACADTDIAVAVCLQLGAPVDDRFTGLAASSVLVAVNITSCFLVQNGQLRVMIVPGINSVIDLCCHIDTTTEGNIARSGFNVAEENAGRNINNGAVTSLKLRLGSDGSVSNVVRAIPGPQADRNAQQGLLAGQCAVILSGQADSHDIFNRVNIGVCTIGHDLAVSIQLDVFHFVARSHDHVLQFPLIGGIQLNIRLKVRNSGCVRSLEVHIVDGIALRHFTGVIVAIQVDNALCFLFSFAYLNGKLARYLHIVTQVIRNLEGYHMLALGQSQVIGGSHGLAIQDSVNRITVQENLSRLGIQTGTGICNNSSKGSTAGGDDCAIAEFLSNVGGCEGNISDSRQDAIIHSGGVVQGEIIEIEGQVCSDSRLHIEADKGRLTAKSSVRIIGCNIVT